MLRIDNSHSAPGSGTSSQVEAEYPERFRVRLAGRIDQVWIPAVHDKPLYQAELIVAKSKPLQWASPLALIGMPIVEPPGEDFDDEQEDSQNAETAISDGDQQQSVLGKNPMTESLEVRFPSRPPFSVGERVTLIWHGQRMVSGLLAGCLLRCSGVISTHTYPPVMYNPRYEIVPQYFLDKDPRRG